MVSNGLIISPSRVFICLCPHQSQTSVSISNAWSSRALQSWTGWFWIKPLKTGIKFEFVILWSLCQSFKTHHEPLRIVGDELNRIRSTVTKRNGGSFDPPKQFIIGLFDKFIKKVDLLFCDYKKHAFERAIYTALINSGTPIPDSLLKVRIS